MNYMTQFAIIGVDQYFSEGHFKIQPEIPKGKVVIQLCSLKTALLTLYEVK